MPCHGLQIVSAAPILPSTMPASSIQLTPEQSTVLVWLRGSNTAPEGAPPDWQKVSGLAALLGIGPYLDYVLRGSSAAPPEVLKRFEFHRQVNSVMQVRRIFPPTFDGK